MSFDVCDSFRKSLEDSTASKSTAIAAIEALMGELSNCKAGTLQELVRLLNKATARIRREVDCSSVSVASGAELFLRFITLASEAIESERNDFEAVREIMLKRGQVFLQKLSRSRPKIAELARPFLRDGLKILVHSYSKCVLEAIKVAKLAGNHVDVLITESALDKSGVKMSAALEAEDVKATVILDASVGYVMNGVDCVLLGAEGVVESGGIVNKIGSYTIAVCAKEMNKPVYVVCESFKFVRLYPLGQTDLPDEFKYKASVLNDKTSDLSMIPPAVDYTPPSLITLLFTDLGILTPSAVSDELIKLYL